MGTGFGCLASPKKKKKKVYIVHIQLPSPKFMHLSLIKLLRLPLLFLFHLCLIYILADLYVMMKYLKTHLRTILSFIGFSHPN